MEKRIIFHIDVNNAFLSWSAVKLLNNGYKVDIRKIPSIIGGDESKRRGIVLAKSPIAKKYGIKTAETLYSARKKCPKLKVFSPDYEWYYKQSRELKTVPERKYLYESKKGSYPCRGSRNENASRDQIGSEGTYPDR